MISYTVRDWGTYLLYTVEACSATLVSISKLFHGGHIKGWRNFKGSANQLLVWKQFICDFLKADMFLYNKVHNCGSPGIEWVFLSFQCDTRIMCYINIGKEIKF